MDLFEAQSLDALGTPSFDPNAPLAVRMRPRTIGEVVGQEAVLAEGSPLRRLLEGAKRGAPQGSSLVLWGPPGTGKTTLAYLVARAEGRRFEELSAVSSGVKDIRDVVSAARRRTATAGEQTVLFIDEVHRFSKSQQDGLLPAVENQWVTLIAATTENPSFSVIPPLLSRSLLLVLEPLDEEAIGTLIDRALDDERGLRGAFGIEEEAKGALIRLAGSDAR
ncbi:AAA family ATPase, partial [Schaalia hyovaginalis]|uniref:AAA family ATPase n=2 Tax=Actinomycetaceae TaxID=2049 RepID=UPI0026F0E6D5